jgi:Domain of unknown function (DUF4430)
VRRRRTTALASALLTAALAIAGCGVGPGADVGRVSLTVTRDYGAERLLGPKSEEASESDTVMRLLDRNADISTRYGGGFVAAIDGLSEAVRDGRRYDWFFYVNGVESPVGAADYPLHGGDAVWWDYRDWSAAEQVPATVGSWPQPFHDGYEGERRPVAVECLGGGAACGEARARLRAAGASLAQGSAGGGSSATTAGTGGSPSAALRVLVGPWAAVREDAAAAQLEEGPQVSGVFADFALVAAGAYRLEGLDEGGGEARAFGRGAGLVAATRRYEAPPVWVVTGATQSGVTAAARLLDAADLRDHYAVAIEGGKATPLPIGAPAP